MKKGISLITLIITIIVIVILAAAIILSLRDTNIIDSANEAVIRNDISSLESELEMYALDKYLSEEGDYDLTKLNANSDRAIYDGEEIENITIYDIVKSLDKISYKDDIVIEDGKIKYIGDNDKIKDILPSEKVEENLTNPVISIQNLFPDSLFEFNENVVVTIDITDSEEITSVDLTNKIKLYNESNNVVYTDSDSEIIISEVTGNLTNKQVAITLNANSISQGGIYTLAIEKGIAKNKYNRYDLLDKNVEFYVGDNPPTPLAPQINLSTDEYTNQDILASIIYSEDSVVKQYRYDINDPWIDYTEPITITENKLILAQGINELGASNESVRSINNIDKIDPVVTFVNDTSWKNSINTPDNYITNYNITDAGGSGGKEQYAIYLPSINPPSDITNGPFSFDATTHGISTLYNGEFYLHIKAVDNAGNSKIYTSDVYRVDRIFSNGVFSPNSSNEAVQSKTVSFNPSDSGGSGVYRWRYRISTNDGITYGDWSSYINGDTTSNIILDQSGINKIHVQVYDNARNGINLTSGSYIISEPTIEEQFPDVVDENTTIDGNNPTKQNPIIPKGFKPVNAVNNAGSVVASWDNINTDWNKGLVIEDVVGNQFVWIPVDRLGSYRERTEEIVTYNKLINSYNSWYDHDIVDDVLPSGILDETTQITTYGGYYVGRYEAGKEATNVLVSKDDAYVWYFLTYRAAKYNSENMYNDSNLYGVRSGLLTTKMWDTMLDYLHEHHGKTNDDISVNSSSWGNYKNSSGNADISGHGSLQVTGYSDYWQAGNIYDVAGNVWEFTNTINDGGGSDFYYSRGGYYLFDSPAMNMTTSYGDNINIDKRVGFRIALFILP